MLQLNQKSVTVIYFDAETLSVNHHVGSFPAKNSGRVILSDSFKQGKSIIAVCEGENLPLEMDFCL